MIFEDDYDEDTSEHGTTKKNLFEDDCDEDAAEDKRVRERQTVIFEDDYDDEVFVDPDTGEEVGSENQNQKLQQADAASPQEEHGSVRCHQQLNQRTNQDQGQQPETLTSPITNHFDSVLECLDFLQAVEDDENVEKADVIDALRGRLHNMLSKILLNNTITSMSMLGWRLE